MRITDLLRRQGVALGISVKTKAEAIDKLIALQQMSGNLTDPAGYKTAILKREDSGTTAVGDGIAIPHAKTNAVFRAGLSVITVPSGVDYDAPDGKPSKLLFMIAAPLDGDVHLEVLAKLMTLLMDEQFRESLLKAPTVDAFLKTIDDKENENTVKQEKNGYKVLAVTACPTGIAHTYMAAQALEQAGEKLGYPLKAETNGSGGAKNVLTEEEIKAADGIIIAADKTVDMARFDGKRVISTKVADGIHKPQELIERIISGDVPIYHHAGGKSDNSDIGREGVGRTVYKHLMNGVSHMLPFVVAGGIFIALAFLIDTLSGNADVTNGTFGSISPIAGFFKSVGDFVFGFMLPILSGYIAMSIADRPGLLVGFAGGYLAAQGSAFWTIEGSQTVSGFLGALFIGFVGGYIMLGIEKICDYLPNALEGIKPVLIYPIFGLAAVAVVMYAVNPIMGLLNSGLNNLLNSMRGGSTVVLGVVLGAMMSIDMGGPFNKAAYLFATGLIAANPMDSSFMIMAAVMVGGMVPPIAIALATTFFKSRFTSQEVKNGPVNYVMGASFITEGAIPYAAADPLRVIPACAIGAGVAGGLSMLFRCTLMAPHGGIFVFALVGNWPWYLLSLAVGSVVGMLLLGLFKRPIKAE